MLKLAILYVFVLILIFLLNKEDEKNTTKNDTVMLVMFSIIIGMSAIIVFA